MKNDPVRETKSSAGMDIASNPDAMTPDLDIAIPGIEEASVPGDDFQPVLSGLIQEGVLPDILQMISSNQRTGIFTLDSDGKQIDLFFGEGEMYHAVADDMTGQTAFFAAMALEGGRFYFRETDELPEDFDRRRKEPESALPSQVIWDTNDLPGSRLG